VPDPGRVRVVRDALIASVRQWWAPTAPDEVVAKWWYDVYATGLAGRKVLFVPEAYSGFPVSRGEDGGDYSYQVWVVERYEGQGDPPDEWIDARLDFASALNDYLGDFRRVPYLPSLPLCYPAECDVTTVVDLVDLYQNKLFVSVVTVLLREDGEEE
jgi:hypothetical protein